VQNHKYLVPAAAAAPAMAATERISTPDLINETDQLLDWLGEI